MKIGSILCAVCVLGLAGQAGAAVAEFQGPEVTWDTWMRRSPGHSSGDYNSGGSSYGRTYNMTSGYSRHILVKFDLSDIPAGATVNSAELKVRRYSGTSNFYAYQLTKDWIEGGQYVDGGDGYASAEAAHTATTYNWLHDGCNASHTTNINDLYCIRGSDWTQGSYSDTWYYDVGEAVQDHPTQSGEYAIYPEYHHTYDRLRNYEVPAKAPQMFSSELELHNNAPFSGYSGLGYYWDTAAQRLYVSREEGVADDPGHVYYVPADKAWNIVEDIKGGSGTELYGEFDNPPEGATGEWLTCNDADLLEIVRNWVEDGELNGGFLLSADGTSYLFLSELQDENGDSIQYDFVNDKFDWESGFDPLNGVEVMGFEPRLTINWVPEPATMGLLGLGFSGMLLFRRRRK